MPISGVDTYFGNPETYRDLSNQFSQTPNDQLAQMINSLGRKNRCGISTTD